MVFHWSLSNGKSPRESRTLLSILADLQNAVVWMVSTRPLISKSSSLCTNTLMTVPSAPIAITFIIITIIIIIIASFSNQPKLIVLHWNLRDNESSQISRTLLGIPGVLNYAVVWMFLAHPSISNFPAPLLSL